MLQYTDENAPLSTETLKTAVHQSLATCDLDGKHVLFVVPDATRSMPMQVMFRALCDACQGRTRQTDFLVALGTHPAMTETELCAWMGITEEERLSAYADVGLYNHEWKNPNALVSLGTFTEKDTGELSEGLLKERVNITVNRRLTECDMVCVVGPVFPHEVVGFSGGNKYFFPGCAGAEILDFFHWLGALITNNEINGIKDTPVRAVIDRAAAMLNVEKRCFCLNVSEKHCHGLFFGSPEDAWSAAADMAARTHIKYVDHPYQTILALAPKMYDEIWTAGKCMYKLEPIIADGGELIIYAPHVETFSVTHDEHLRRIGYHVRDYFLAHWPEFSRVPRGVLAHSTHVRGTGRYEQGVESPRVQVTLATSIPEKDCRAMNLGYRAPVSIDESLYRQKVDCLVVPNAGEVLYRLREAS